MKNKNRKLIFAFVSVAIVGLGTIFLITTRSQSQSKDQNSGVNKNDPQRFDKNNPTADFDMADSMKPEEGELRKRRGDKYKENNQIDEAEEWVVTTMVSHMPNPPAFPIAHSDLIAVGTVKNARAFISTDKTAVYSEFDVSLGDVLFSLKRSILPGSEIVIERMGGNVRFPSGKIVTRGIGDQPLPRKDKTYVLFLKWDQQGEDYLILTGYEVGTDAVKPLDGNSSKVFEEYNRYRLITKDEFFKQLRAAIANASGGGKQ